MLTKVKGVYYQCANCTSLKENTQYACLTNGKTAKQGTWCGRDAYICAPCLLSQCL